MLLRVVARILGWCTAVIGTGLASGGFCGAPAPRGAGVAVLPSGLAFRTHAEVRTPMTILVNYVTLPVAALEPAAAFLTAAFPLKRRSRLTLGPNRAVAVPRPVDPERELVLCSEPSGDPCHIPSEIHLMVGTPLAAAHLATDPPSASDGIPPLPIGDFFVAHAPRVGGLTWVSRDITSQATALEQAGAILFTAGPQPDFFPCCDALFIEAWAAPLGSVVRVMTIGCLLHRHGHRAMKPY